METNKTPKENQASQNNLNGNSKTTTVDEDSSNLNGCDESVAPMDETLTPVKNNDDHSGLQKETGKGSGRTTNNVRDRSSSEGSNSEEDEQKKQKVGVSPSPSAIMNAQAASPPAAAAGFFFTGVAASPPKFVSLEQIMKAANAVSNLSLAHEIVVNKDFKLEKTDLPEDSFQGKIKNIIHKAFWDVLESDLDADPPNYSQALTLLTEIKAGLLSLLLPHHTKLHQEINEVLDVDLIKQQVQNGTLDFHYYAQYIISVMSKMCAPVRDEEIQELMRVGDVIPLFRGIFKTLDLMKLDMANFNIQLIRPQLQEQTVEYEKKKFAEYLTLQDDGLEATRAWLKRSVDRLIIKMAAEEKEENKSEKSNTPPTSAKILTESYMELLQWDENLSFPETLMLDKTRFLELCKRIDYITLTAAVLLVTFSTMGSSIAGISQFKEQLKNHLGVLLEGIEKNNLQETMKNVALQVAKEVDECLVKHGFPEMSAEKQGILLGQIEEVSEPNHKVRQLVETRILEFVEVCLSSLTASPVRIPPGLSTMQAELSRLTGQFLRLVSHNRAVFGDYYSEIINTIRKNGIAKEQVVEMNH